MVNKRSKGTGVALRNTEKITQQGNQTISLWDRIFVGIDDGKQLQEVTSVEENHTGLKVLHWEQR